MKLLKIATAAILLIVTSVAAQRSSLKKAEYQKYWAKRAQQGIKDYTPLQPQTGNVGDFLQCASCKLSMTAFDAYFTTRSTEDLLESFATYACGMVIDPTVCQGAVHEMGDIVIESLAEGVLDPDFFCSEFAGYCSASNYYIFYSEDWVD